MARRDRNPFLTVTSTGGLLPIPLLERIAAEPDSLPGTDPGDYELIPGKRLREIINRSWNDLLGAWQAFRTKADQLASTDPATTLTRDRWLLPLLRELGWHSIEPANGAGKLWVDADDGHHQDDRRREWPITHEWNGHVAVHLMGWNVPLDTRTQGIPGAATAAPHSTLQDFLNAADTHLWGLVCNGRQLRILRDSTSLTRQSYIEFDLETMFDNQVFSDFVVLWMLAHATRFAARPTLQDCWLEQWQHASHEQGVRALEDLRKGVETAIAALGTGLLAHPANQQLRASLRDGTIDRRDLYRQLLRLVYRLVFLFVVEDRDLLHDPDTDRDTRALYAQHYSTARLRDQAGRHTGGRHPDGWQQLEILLTGLADDDGIPSLGLPSLAGGLFDPDWTPALANNQMANRDLYEALRALAFTTIEGVRSRIDYRNLGSEELGSVYESLLELHPTVDPDQRIVSLESVAGNERKTTGAYYTPTSLIAQLLDDALDPIVEEAVSGKDDQDAERAILDMTICDPACGSAHFLVAAAHRLAKYVAIARTGDPEPAPLVVQQALRDVVSRCIHGVDVNPMAVELAKVSLWLECHVPGQPLTFLDHHIKCGNSLLGVHSPELIDWRPDASKVAEQKGIYDAAFTPLHGDDKAAVGKAKKRNRALRGAKQGKGALVLSFEEPTPTGDEAIQALAADASELRTMGDASLAALRAKRQRWLQAEESDALRRERLRADAWCASFTLPKTNRRMDTHVQHPWDVYYALSGGQDLPDDNQGVVAARSERDRHRYFHWYLEFPDVHDRGGFDVMLGNPPWERIKIQEKEWFATRAPDIAKATNKAARDQMIKALYSAPVDSPDRELAEAWDAAQHEAAAQSHFIRHSGAFPLGGVGDVNVYAVFADLFRQTISPQGQAGFICPTGLAVGATYANFFGHLISTQTIATFYSFENEERLFPGVEHYVKFALVTIVGSDRPVQTIAFTGYVRQASQIRDPGRRYELRPPDIEAINPNTSTAPLFRYARDAEITAKIHRNAPVLVRDGEADGDPWRLNFMAMFHMANDSQLFVTEEQARAQGGSLAGSRFHLPGDRVLLPLYEARLAYLYDHRYSTYEGQTGAQARQGVAPHVEDSQHRDPAYEPLFRYWIDETAVKERLSSRDWDREWLPVWRDLANWDRSLVPSVVPLSGVGHTLTCWLPGVEARDCAYLLGILSSLACDYSARQRLTNRVSQFLFKQLPVPQPMAFSGINPVAFVVPRVVELMYTAYGLTPFADDCGFQGPPFKWDPERRSVLQAEIDALVCHLYGLDRDDVDWLLDSFTVLRKYEEMDPGRGGFGEFRTKRLVLEHFDAMRKSAESGTPYETTLEVPPAHNSMRHEVADL